MSARKGAGLPRLNKRARHEARFGRPMRLADAAFETPWVVLNAWRGTGTAEDVAIVRDALRQELKGAVVVQASNVGHYLYCGTPQERWDIHDDFPSCVPTHARMFVEFTRPPYINSGGVKNDTSRYFPLRWGWLVTSTYPDSAGEYNARLMQQEGVMAMEQAVLVAEWPKGIAVLGELRTIRKSDGSIDGMPQCLLFGNLSEADADRMGQDVWAMAWPMFLTLSFMNCKNVRVEPVEPDARLNRERRKAGLRPFVRYHTVNIEPMKAVLRTEGGAESNGLRRALHICRGHFATYSTSYFGRPVEKPVTVWRPAHVRGEASEGIVFKDYAVHAPEAN